MNSITIIILSVLSGFVLGFIVGCVVNLRRKVADKREEYNMKLKELRELPSEWNNEDMDWNYKKSAESFMSFVDHRLAVVAKIHTNFIPGGKLNTHSWYDLMHFFYVLTRSGLCLKVYSVKDHVEDWVRDQANKDFKMDTYRMYPHLAEKDSAYQKYKELEKIVKGRY